MEILDVMNPTNARSNFYEVLKAVNENHKPILINGSKGENSAVIIGKEDWDNIQEILNLEYSNTVNKSHKQKAESLYDTIEQQSVVASYGDANSSLWGKRIANDTVEEGHRVFHVVANNFEYDVNDEESEIIDLSEGNLNPIEMFGDIERDEDKKVQIFNTNLLKIVQMFNLMSGRVMKSKQKTMTEDSLVTFYKQKRMWADIPEKYPNELKIYGLKSETVPKMSDFTTQLTDILVNEKLNRKHSIEDEIRDAEHLQKVMNNILKKYHAIINTITTLPDPKTIDKTQIYYDLSGLSEDSKIMEAQYLNTLHYILSVAEAQDVIMIHGLDKMSVETLSVLKNSLKRAIDRDVKIVYLFDTIGGKEEKNDVEYANLFNTDGILYQDINADFGFKTLGTMNLKDMELYREKIEKSLD